MFNPESFVRGKELSFGKGNIAICTLWSQRKQIEGGLLIGNTFIPDNQFAIAGNLYSVAGIGYLITNCLNNGITKVAITGVDFTGVGSILRNRNYAPDDVGLPAEYIALFNNTVEFIHPFMLLKDELDYHNSTKAIGTRYYCPEPMERETPDEPLPGLEYGVKVAGNNLKKIHQEICHKVYHHGIKTEDKEGNYRLDTWGIQATILPETEIASSGIDEQVIEQYGNQLYYGGGSDGVSYTYGDLIRNKYRDQIYAIKKAIAEKVETYRAYISLWEPATSIDMENPPCLTSIQIRIYNGSLNMVAQFRTQDMFGGWLLNAVGLLYWQEMLCFDLGIKKGALIVHSNAAHLYGRDIIKVEKYIENFTSPLILEPLAITVWKEEEFYCVGLFDNGVQKMVIREKSKERLCKKIGLHLNSIQHALYVGREIERLE